MASEELTLREVFLADAYEEHVERLEKRIEELEQRVKELEAILNESHLLYI